MDWLQWSTECFSVSTDGYVYWWDIRRTGEPVEELLLKERGGDTVLGAVSVEYESIAGPTKFMIGTEQGTVLMCNGKAERPPTRRRLVSRPPRTGVLAGANPWFPKYFMSVGDWTARVWMEDIKTPIMTTRYHGTYLTGGTWSPAAGRLLPDQDGRRDGRVGLLLQAERPDAERQGDGQAADRVQHPGRGRHLESGCRAARHRRRRRRQRDSHGVCDGLAVMQPNEKPTIQMFERETRQEKNLEARQKELRNEAKRAARSTGRRQGGHDVQQRGGGGEGVFAATGCERRSRVRASLRTSRRWRCRCGTSEGVGPDGSSS